MNLMRSLLFFAVLFMTACQFMSSHRSINTEGSRVEVSDHLVSGKMNVVYFYADW